ncbi:unnamed protein product [Gadus morhua 'NCC']
MVPLPSSPPTTPLCTMGRAVGVRGQRGQLWGGPRQMTKKKKKKKIILPGGGGGSRGAQGVHQYLWYRGPGFGVTALTMGTMSPGAPVYGNLYCYSPFLLRHSLSRHR